MELWNCPYVVAYSVVINMKQVMLRIEYQLLMYIDCILFI